MVIDKFTYLVNYVSLFSFKLDKYFLNQVCWYSDIYCYRDLGSFITDAEYEKGEAGVVVSDGRLQKTLDFLSAKKNLDYKEGRLFRLDLCVSPLSKREEHIISGVIKDFCSDRLEQFFWWDSLEIGEKIPKNCVFAVAGEINSDDMEWALDGLGDDAVRRLERKKLEEKESLYEYV